MFWFLQMKPQNINDTLKRKLIGTYDCKRQGLLSEKVVVDGHGCHTARLVSKLK